MATSHTPNASPTMVSRRDFIRLASLSTAGLILACAANPVTGRRQLMLVSEDEEIQIDKRYAPHQFSTDYGVTQDSQLNAYIERTGRQLGARTHRSRMPYSFRVVNATYVNAYAFPGGSIAVTRGILLALENEAELAALLGHELGHVNARHTAQQMSKGMLTQMVVGGLSAAAGSQGATYGRIASAVGMLGAGALLASYSRDNEREADALGMEYMVRGGYSSQGMVDLMEMLNDMNKRQLNAAELLFATHPMSDERYRTSVQAATTRYGGSRSNPIHRERYLDHTAALRRKRAAIEAIQTGEKALGQKNYREAQTHFAKALKQSPDDYAGLLLMAKCQLMQDNPAEAGSYAQAAQQVYPSEAQAYHISGFAGIKQKKFAPAYEAFQAYDRLLPGNPSTTFFQGYCLEGMERIPAAAEKYRSYLQAVNQGEQAEYAYRRLVQWGYLKPSS